MRRFIIREEGLEILKQELTPTLRLAWPLVLANLGWMAMGIVDTMMVGRVSAEAIGAVSLGGIVFILGLPLGYFLCFERGWGAAGLWTGLCAALILIGSVLLVVWQRKVPAWAESLIEA